MSTPSFKTYIAELVRVAGAGATQNGKTSHPVWDGVANQVLDRLLNSVRNHAVDNHRFTASTVDLAIDLEFKEVPETLKTLKDAAAKAIKTFTDASDASGDRTKRAGLEISVSRVEHRIRAAWRGQVAEEGQIALAAVLQALILMIAGPVCKVVKDQKRVRIEKEDIMQVIGGNAFYAAFFQTQHLQALAAALEPAKATKTKEPRNAPTATTGAPASKRAKTSVKKSVKTATA